jgi:hypothetical protein
VKFAFALLRVEMDSSTLTPNKGAVPPPEIYCPERVEEVSRCDSYKSVENVKSDGFVLKFEQQMEERRHNFQ